MCLCLFQIRPLLEQRIRQHFDQHLFRARARLDLPTSEDPAVQHQLKNAMPSNGQRVAVSAWNNCLFLLRATAKVTSQIGVHVKLLHEQPNGMLLATLIFVMAWIDQAGAFYHGPVTARGRWLQFCDYISVLSDRYYKFGLRLRRTKTIYACKDTRSSSRTFNIAKSSSLAILQRLLRHVGCSPHISALIHTCRRNSVQDLCKAIGRQ